MFIGTGWAHGLARHIWAGGKAGAESVANRVGKDLTSAPARSLPPALFLGPLTIPKGWGESRGPAPGPSLPRLPGRERREEERLAASPGGRSSTLGAGSRGEVCAAARGSPAPLHHEGAPEPRARGWMPPGLA